MNVWVRHQAQRGEGKLCQFISSLLVIASDVSAASAERVELRQQKCHLMKDGDLFFQVYKVQFLHQS